MDCATVSVKDAARRLGISRGFAYAKVKDGTIRCVRIGRAVRVPLAVLDEMLRRGCA
jgi:excisionase family DNA binding protein